MKGPGSRGGSKIDIFIKLCVKDLHPVQFCGHYFTPRCETCISTEASLLLPSTQKGLKHKNLVSVADLYYILYLCS